MKLFSFIQHEMNLLFYFHSFVAVGKLKFYSSMAVVPNMKLNNGMIQRCQINYLFVYQKRLIEGENFKFASLDVF